MWQPHGNNKVQQFKGTPTMSVDGQNPALGMDETQSDYCELV